MSYDIAKRCFKENIRLTGGAQKDPVSFNLYNGLFQLAEQLEHDIGDVQARIRRVENQLR